MKASSESGLWAMEISRMAAETAAADCWGVTECTNPFDEDYVAGKERGSRCCQRSHPAAKDAAATTFRASPGRKGSTDSDRTTATAAWVSIASHRAPMERMSKLPAAALTSAGTNPPRLRR